MSFPIALSLAKYKEDQKLYLSSYFACVILQLANHNLA